MKTYQIRRYYSATRPTTYRTLEHAIIEAKNNNRKNTSNSFLEVWECDESGENGEVVATFDGDGQRLIVAE